MKALRTLTAILAILCTTSVLADVDFSGAPQKHVATITEASKVGVDGRSPWGDIPADASIEAVIEAGVPEVYNSGESIHRIMSYIGSNTNVWIEVTNYYGTVGIPASMQMYERRDGEIKEVWDQRKWTDYEIDKKLVAVSNMVENSPARKWSRYQSYTGTDNPLTDTTWISTPKIALSGGFEWQKNVVAAGDIYVLHNNGLIMQSGTDEGNYFCIEDVEGEKMFTIKKTNDETLSARATAVSADGSSLVVGYSVEASEHPKCQVAMTLADGGIHFYDEDDPLCPASCSWDGQSGNWRVTITPKYVTNGLFAKATYVKQGMTLIESNAVMTSTKGYLCTDGIHRVAIDWNNGNPKFVEVK